MDTEISSEEWEVFDPTVEYRRNKEPMVTIGQSGNLYLNTVAFYLLSKPSRVSLFYNRDRQIIGIRCAESELEKSTAVRTSASSHIIAGRAFTKYFDIDARAMRKYRATLQDDMLMVDLNQEWQAE